MTPSAEALQQLVEVALGRRPGCLLLKNARLVNVFTRQLDLVDILIHDGWFASVGSSLVPAATPLETRDLAGAYVIPGLIDGHLHLESSLVTPAEYAKAVVPRGVTGIVADPHEVANVAGPSAIAWMLEASRDLPLEVWFTVSSSVPSSRWETSGAVLDLPAMAALLAEPRMLGVAELMSVAGFLEGDLAELSKVVLAEKSRKVADGHAPGLTGTALQAYLASGIGSDHESTTLSEGREKLAAGCFLMIREGSATRNLEALVSLITPEHGERVGLVTDDRLPDDLLREGGVDFLVRKAIALGADPRDAIRCATINPARYFGLRRRGAIAPGYQADLVILEDLVDCKALEVYQRGRKVAEAGELVVDLCRVPAEPNLLKSVHVPSLSLRQLELDAVDEEVRVIRAIPSQILTQAVRLKPKCEAGKVVADLDRDLLKLACVERHGRHGRCQLGLVQGFGLKRGAIAGSVAHDHHNLMALGTNDQDILCALQRLGQGGGGLVVVEAGVVVAELPLPIAGLLSDQPLETVRRQLEAVNAAAQQRGCTMPAPFMALSFLGLAVIPELRLTDQGLVDVLANRLVPLV
jgi:adenine deaminase